tara:strand:- start:447 stop:803 length:357 start_codon:yes stop_codon:yes gene_type:complete
MIAIPQEIHLTDAGLYLCLFRKIKPQEDEQLSKVITLKDNMIISFNVGTGENIEYVEKKIKVDGDQRVFTIKQIIEMCRPFIRLEYPDYKSPDLIQEVEIYPDGDATHVHLRRSHTLN